MQDDQQKQLKDMKENIGYYQKKAQELEVQYKEQCLPRTQTSLFDCRLYPSHGPLRFITSHSRFALASAMRKTKRLRRRLEHCNTYICTLYGINVYRHVINIESYLSTLSAFYPLVILFYINFLQLQLNISVTRSIIIHGLLTVSNLE